MPEEIITTETTSELSLSDKFIGILSSPGEIYEQMARSEKKNSNWSLPAFIALVSVLISMFVMFSQPAIQDQLHENQVKAMQHQVDQGKMTQEQMEKGLEFSKGGSPMFLIFGSVGMVFYIYVSLFGFSLGYWLLGKIFFKSSVSYLKICETYGLGMLIIPVSTIISLVFIVAMGSMYAGPNLGMLVSEIDPMNKTHTLLTAISALSIWQFTVVGIGLSKVWSISTVKGISASLVFWLVVTVGMNYIGMLFGR